MAVTIQADALATELGIPEAKAIRLLAVATEMAENYAPLSPDAMSNESVIRFVGYLVASEGGGYGAQRKTEVGPLTVEYTVNHAMAFRNSGAQALLTHYKVRRAGAI